MAVANLRQIGLKMRERQFKELSSSQGGAMSLTPLPPPPHPPFPARKVHLWHIFFAVPAMNGCLPAELKFRVNTAEAPGPNHGPWVQKSSLYHYHYHY